MSERRRDVRKIGAFSCRSRVMLVCGCVAWCGVAGNGVAVGSVCVVLFTAFTSLTRRDSRLSG